MIAPCERCKERRSYNRRVQVQQATETQDDLGAPVEAWATVRNWWVERKDVRGQERFRSDQEIAVRTAVFTGRWFSGLTAKMRLVHDGLTWDIEGIAELGRRHELEVTATAARV